MRLRNKVVVVTGANGLLGLTFSQALLAEGANVIALDLKYQNLIELKGPSYEMQVVDVTDERAVMEVVHVIEKRYGRVDGLVNAAAINDNLWPFNSLKITAVSKLVAMPRD